MEKIEEIYYHKCKNGTEAHIVLKRDPETGKMVFKECIYSLYGKYSLKDWEDLAELSLTIIALCNTFCEDLRTQSTEALLDHLCKDLKPKFDFFGSMDNVKKSHKVGTNQRKPVKNGVNNQKK